MAFTTWSVMAFVGFHSFLQGVSAVQSEPYHRLGDKSERALLGGRDVLGQPFRPREGVNEHKIDITINHLAKAGGTFVHDMVEHSLPKDRLTWEREGDGITEFESKENFVIGMVRNPLNYYVSLWSYTSDKNHCCFRNSIPVELQEDVFGHDAVLGSTEADKQRFRRWLRLVSTQDLGLMSMRFYGSYLNFGRETTLGKQDDGLEKAASEWERGSVPWVLENRARYLLGMSSLPLPGLMNSSEMASAQQLVGPDSAWQRNDYETRSVMARVRAVAQGGGDRFADSLPETASTRVLTSKIHSLKQAIVGGIARLLMRMQTATDFGNRAVNCWMYTERIVPDLQACLERYEDVAARFEHRGMLVNWKRFHDEVEKANHNQALPHVDCHSFYDEETRQFVLHSDAKIFEAFGYPPECS